MPPKKKGGKGGGKGSSGKGSGEGGSNAAFDARAREATMAMFHQLDQDKLSALSARFDEVMREKQELQSMVARRETRVSHA